MQKPYKYEIFLFLLPLDEPIEKSALDLKACQLSTGQQRGPLQMADRGYSFHTQESTQMFCVQHQLYSLSPPPFLATNRSVSHYCKPNL